MKIISWNVNGIRAWFKKGSAEWVFEESPDIFCVQETKANAEQLTDEIKNLNGEFNYSYFNSSVERKGHSGVAIYSKIKPDNVTYGLGVDEFDKQGRQINFFFDKNVLINCYFPNGGGDESRLIYKLNYFEHFLKFVKKLEKQGYNVIFCGDVNIAHEEIDLARPDSNKNEVGFLPEERIIIDEFIDGDFVDVFRETFREKIKYTWWDMKTFARDRNVGWRIDYFFVKRNFFNKVKKTEIHNDVFGSDHCPISLEI